MPRPSRPLLPLMHWLLWLLMALLPLRGWAWTQMPGLPAAAGTAVGVTSLPPCHLQPSTAEPQGPAQADHHRDDSHPTGSHNSHNSCTLCDVCHTGLAPSLSAQGVWPQWPQCPPLTAVPCGLPEGVVAELFRPPRLTTSSAV